MNQIFCDQSQKPKCFNLEIYPHKKSRRDPYDLLLLHKKQSGHVSKKDLVVYFTPAPTQKALKDCVLSSGEIGPGCVGNAGTRNFKRQIAAGAASSFGAKVIDSREWTCVFQGCPAMVGKVAVYADGSHFTRQFAVTLAPLFRAWLNMEGMGN